jgi:murein DD-endopeptidase MepM/ murein hydrolase activator NlpD
MNKTVKKSIPLLAIVGGGIWLRLVKFESGKPTLRLAQESSVVGVELGFQASDDKSGLLEVMVEAIQAGLAFPLFSQKFPPQTRSFEKALPLRPLPQGLSDGDVLVRITAEDRSWNGGNTAILEEKMIIDTRPPQMSVGGGPHYINQGGVGFLTYTTNEEILSSGIQVGDALYGGYPVDKNRFQAFFALPYGSPEDVSFHGLAEDPAGNKTNIGIRIIIKKKSFKKDKINISDGFLADVLPYFKERDPSLQGADIDIFLAVNRKQRELDAEKIRTICRNSAPKPSWSGAFLRLPNSKPMAAYGDERTYFYKGNEIDRQIHLGVDLASLAQSPIPAANSGRVAYAGPLGIYGESVVLDHGCGLFSLYAHLSRIDVEIGKDVARGAILGRSGSTGMAGGDHLHFAMLVQGVFVNPVEWWDEHWIRDNVELKMK